MKKFILYGNKGDFAAKNAEVETFLGIPEEGTSSYAAGDQVANSASSDFGKYIMPVFTSGKFDSLSLFDESSLIDWGEDWTKPI